MKKSIFLLCCSMLSVTLLFGQEKYYTKTGHVSFHSETPLEKIEAHNYQVTSIFYTESGEMDFPILIKGFEFEKTLMQEHFNENYMESDKYPKATFKGKIKNYDKTILSKDGTYNVELEGNMTIHNVVKKITVKGTIEVKNGQIHAKSSFPITLKDYNINIPPVAKGKISETVQVKVDMSYMPYQKK